MSDPIDPNFGDFVPEDAFDSAEPDPEAVARIFLKLQRQLSGDDERPDLEELPELERVLLLFTFAALLARLRREGGI